MSRRAIAGLAPAPVAGGWAEFGFVFSSTVPSGLVDTDEWVTTGVNDYPQGYSNALGDNVTAGFTVGNNSANFNFSGSNPNGRWGGYVIGASTPGWRYTHWRTDVPAGTYLAVGAGSAHESGTRVDLQIYRDGSLFFDWGQPVGLADPRRNASNWEGLDVETEVNWNTNRLSKGVLVPDVTTNVEIRFGSEKNYQRLSYIGFIRQ